MTTFDTHINGIECQCKVEFYRPYLPANLSGPPEEAMEEEPAEFTFTILDRCGNPAPTLQDIATDEDVDRLQDEYEAFVAANKHGKEF